MLLPKRNIYCLLVCLVTFASAFAQTGEKVLSLGGFGQWITGHDPGTIQIIPAEGNNALVVEDGEVYAHVKFKVTQYGEVSFPINQKTLPHEEALRTDLTKSKFIVLTYRSNHELVLQLRQTGVHGGIQNHVSLPVASAFKTVTILFSEFKGGLKPLDLSDVAKFNFAVFANNEADGYAEYFIRDFKIDHYKAQ
jgi:hypothetical protein